MPTFSYANSDTHVLKYCVGCAKMFWTSTTCASEKYYYCPECRGKQTEIVPESNNLKVNTKNFFCYK
jgi:hypothetical protein